MRKIHKYLHVFVNGNGALYTAPLICLPLSEKGKVLVSSIGERIRQARKNLRMSQDELAHRVKKDQRLISQYETGQRRLYADELDKFASALEVPLVFFFGDTESDKLDEEMLDEFHLLPTRAAKETALDHVRVLRRFIEKG